MEMIPNEWGVWPVSRDDLRSKLNEIHMRGGEQLSVVPDSGRFDDYLIIFFTPPNPPPQAMEGSPPGATIQ